MGKCVFGRNVGKVLLSLLTASGLALAKDQGSSGLGELNDVITELAVDGPIEEQPAEVDPNKVALDELLQAVDQVIDIKHGPEQFRVLRLLIDTVAELNGVGLVTFLEAREDSIPAHVRYLALRSCAERDLDQVWDYCASKPDLRMNQEFGQKFAIFSLIDWMPFQDLKRCREKIQMLPDELREFASQAIETRENAVAASLDPDRLRVDSDFRHALRSATFNVSNIDMSNPAKLMVIFEQDGAPIKEGSVAIGTFIERPEARIAVGDLEGIKQNFRQFGRTVPMGFNGMPGLYQDTVTSIIEGSVFEGAAFYTVIGNAKTIQQSDRLFIYRHMRGPGEQFDMLIMDEGQVLLGEAAEGQLVGTDFTGYSLVELAPAA